MQFDSLTFVVFFAIVLFAYNYFSSWEYKKNILLLSSYLFYSAWNPFFLPLLVFSSTIDWWLAKKMSKSENKERKIYLTLIVCLNLSILFYFKYIDFFFDALNDFLSGFGVALGRYEFDIILPLGISFYTFHSLSYCIDIYRKKFEPTQSWRDYSLYVAFFPQLVAGPIVRWTQMREQIEHPRCSSAEGLGVGLTLLLLGLFEKVVLADGVFAPVANQIFAENNVSSVHAWVGTAAFTGQIFCDFAGYSTCAIGAALCLGFRLPTNFRNPYSAVGFADFWQRWHISLSTWLRDYLYIPLGGNRKGTFFTYRNLLLTMLIGGLWHGAAWTFIIWGGLHGAYLIFERFMKKTAKYLHFVPDLVIAIFSWFFTLLAIMYAWVWFRAESVTQAASFTLKLIDLNAAVAGFSMISTQYKTSLYVFLIVVFVHLVFKKLSFEDLIKKLNPVFLVVLVSFLIISISLTPGGSNAFIYFQF